MSLEAKRFRHVAVAIAEACIGRVIAVSPRQESPQPQQPDVAYSQDPGSVGTAANRSIAASASCMSVSEPRRSDSTNAAVVVWRYSATSAGVASVGSCGESPSSGGFRQTGPGAR